MTKSVSCFQEKRHKNDNNVKQQKCRGIKNKAEKRKLQNKKIEAPNG